MKSLLDKFTIYFPNYTSTSLKNIVLLILCIIEGGTVNLYKLRGHVSKIIDNPIEPSSGYKRLIRVFDDYSYSRLWLDLLQCCFGLLRYQTKYLILDGSSWKRNGITRHYLTLSIEYKKVAIPIYWKDLSKLGISSIKERRTMFRGVFKFFNLEGKILLADREYIGIDWFKYLTANKLNFIIRLRNKNYQQYVDDAPGKSYQQLINKVLRSKLAHKAVGKPIQIDGITYMFTVTKYLDTKGKVALLFLLSSLQQKPYAIAASYRLRWKIECCFKHLKSNGFDLQKINLQGRARAKLLMAAMIFAYVLAIHEGLKNYRKVRKNLNQDGTFQKAESVFRNGYDSLIAKLASFSKFFRYFIQEMETAVRSYYVNDWLIV